MCVGELREIWAIGWMGVGKEIVEKGRRSILMIGPAVMDLLGLAVPIDVTGRDRAVGWWAKVGRVVVVGDG